MRNCVAIAIAIAISASATTAFAQSATTQPAQPGPPASTPQFTTTAAANLPPPRIGFELAAGLHAGRIICESEGDFCNDFTEAGGLNLNAAYFISPSFGFTLDLWVMAHSEDDFTFAHYVNTIGVKWRPFPILTLTAGVGSAHASLDYSGAFQASVTSDDAFAVMVAAALDIVRARRWALSVEGRVGNGFYGDEDDNGEADIVGRNVGVGVGLAFFGF